MTAIKKEPGIRAKTVEYLTLSDIRNRDLKVQELPFLKRSPYGDEREFRVIYESSTTKANSLDIEIPLSCIDRITLSPWIPFALSSHLKKTLKEFEGCKSLQVFRSTLISNEKWKNLGEGAI
jgi:hypothetical protein